MYSGVFPIVPTTFDENGELDLDSQRRAVDFLIAAGSSGLCILANYSEQFALSDSERERLSAAIMDQVAGRLPVIVTTSHYSTKLASERSLHAQQAGAAMVMLMPPYHGATVHADERGILQFFQRIGESIDIPIMIQDAPVSGTPLSTELLARLAREVPAVRYFKIEVPGAAVKLGRLIELGGEAIEGPFDGEESITLIPDLDMGATGTMPSGMLVDVLRKVFDDYRAGNRDQAVSLYERYLPLINYENKQCGLRATKALMVEAGIISCEATRHPTPPLHPRTRAGLVELARRLDPMIMSWGR